MHLSWSVDLGSLDQRPSHYENENRPATGYHPFGDQRQRYRQSVRTGSSVGGSRKPNAKPRVDEGRDQNDGVSFSIEGSSTESLVKARVCGAGSGDGAERSHGVGHLSSPEGRLPCLGNRQVSQSRRPFRRSMIPSTLETRSQ